MKGTISKTMMGWHIISEDIDMFPINGIPINKRQAMMLKLSDLDFEVEFDIEEKEFFIWDYYKTDNGYEPKTLITYSAIII